MIDIFLSVISDCIKLNPDYLALILTQTGAKINRDLDILYIFCEIS